MDYDDPDGCPVPDFRNWFRIISEKLVRRPDQQVHVEPGRSIVAQCASLISRVLFVKVGETKNFLVLDAGMNSGKTAEFMGIHTNTVQYRLKKINEMLGVEITGNRVIPGLTMALALKRLERVVS